MSFRLLTGQKTGEVPFRFGEKMVMKGILIFSSAFLFVQKVQVFSGSDVGAFLN